MAPRALSRPGARPVTVRHRRRRRARRDRRAGALPRRGARAADHLRRRARLHQLGGPAAVPPDGRLAAPVRRGPRAWTSAGTAAPAAASATGGDPEMRDVDAAVGAARADGADAVVTVGLSMGGGRRCGRRPWAGTARTPWSASARSAAGTSATPARCGACTGCWRRRPDGGSARGCVGLRLDEPWLIPPTSPAAGGQRDRADPAAARARRPRRVLPARALPHARPGGRARRPPPGWSRASDTPRAARPLRSSSGSDAGLLPRSTRESTAERGAGVRAAGAGAPPAGRRASPWSAVALLVVLPELLGRPRPAGRGPRAAARPGARLGAGHRHRGLRRVAGGGRGGGGRGRPAARRCPSGRRSAACSSSSASASSPPSCSRCSAGPATTSSPRCPARCCCCARSGRWRRCCCSARSTGTGRALVALLAVGAALVVGHLVDLVLPRPQLAPGVPRGLLGPGAGGAGRRRGDLPRPRTSRTCPARATAARLRRGARRRGRAGGARRRATSSSRRPRGAAGRRRRRASPWALSVVQVVAPARGVRPGRPRPADRAVNGRVKALLVVLAAAARAGRARRPGGRRRWPRTGSPTELAEKGGLQGTPGGRRSPGSRSSPRRSAAATTTSGSPSPPTSSASRRAPGPTSRCAACEVPLSSVLSGSVRGGAGRAHRRDGDAVLRAARPTSSARDTDARPRGRRAADHPDRRGARAAACRSPRSARSPSTGDDLVVDVERGLRAPASTSRTSCVERAADLLDLRYAVPALPFGLQLTERHPGRRTAWTSASRRPTRSCGGWQPE